MELRPGRLTISRRGLISEPLPDLLKSSRVKVTARRITGATPVLTTGGNQPRLGGSAIPRAFGSGVAAHPRPGSDPPPSGPGAPPSGPGAPPLGPATRLPGPRTRIAR